LTVAVTGPTGTFGYGLMPLLEAASGIERVIGIARRPFDPATEGWTKMEYRQGDVREPEALREAFADSEVVVHLAFMITGAAGAETIRAINIEGTLNAYRAARDAGARRFVYASSVAAYGFHRDNPIGMTEEWPTRPAEKLFYAREKAELEQLLGEEAAAIPEAALYLLRPPIVLGPHAVGAKDVLTRPAARLGRSALGMLRRVPLPVPMPAPTNQFQFIHEYDVGTAIVKCVLGAGPPGAYNIAGDGVLTGADIARELGLVPLPIPARVVHGTARAVTSVPWPRGVPPAAEWVEALSQPSIMDTTKAKLELGWEPRYTGLEALRETLGTALGNR
jgi:nucleoside-diphosphate-sugar epimerase